MCRTKDNIKHAGADQGFPIGGGANPPGWAPIYDFAKFCQELHKIEKILGCRAGTCRRRPPKSATAAVPTPNVGAHSNIECTYKMKTMFSF